MKLKHSPDIKFSLILLILWISACSPESTTREGSTPALTGLPKSEAYNRNSCTFSFTDGLDAPPTKSAPEIVKVYFEKRIDLSPFKALQNASAKATADFIMNDGVDLFHVPLRSAPEACQNLAELPLAPSHLAEIWKDHDDDETLIGLFLPPHRVASTNPSQRPVILVRPDTDRYTLLHEYLHFLFEKERAIDGLSDEFIITKHEQLLVDFEESLKNLKNITTPQTNESESEKNLDIYLSYLETASSLAHSFVTLAENFPHEEMTIEALLTAAARSNEIKDISEYNRTNSVEYIRASANKSDQIYEALLKDIVNRTETRTALLHTNSANLRQVFREIRQKITKNKRETSELLQKYATTRSSRRNIDLASGVIAEQDQHQHHSGCQHGKTFEAILSDLERIK